MFFMSVLPVLPSQHVWFPAFRAFPRLCEAAPQRVFACMMRTLRLFLVSRLVLCLWLVFGPLGILMLQVEIPLTLSLERRLPILEEQRGCCTCDGTALPSLLGPRCPSWTVEFS